MRVCKCGGIVGQHELTKNREAWTCRSCGRYEIFTKSLTDSEIVDVLGGELDSSDEAFVSFARRIELVHGIHE